MVVRNSWHLFSSHGSILFSSRPTRTALSTRIAEAMCLTRRAVWGSIGDLRQAGMLSVRREGRRHHYTVDLDAPLRHPVIAGYTLRPVLGQIEAKARARSAGLRQVQIAACW